ncbi:Hsp70 family protein [Rhodococcus artemisiae]|uniref:Hsp70 family protein n=1 Tax=Rhodococcus artemisiae TaxID=714159 RepID=A0ABU7LJ24_9NOCA|nr:Hsp70 family protein [Rhodococcus artemisiae]MEE2061549.1 Hsp70 family protein [Rhodococcus artemisiae]
MAGWALSIDFGTSNTATAHTSAISGRIETLPLTHQSNLLPSGVYAESPERILTGSAALAAADRDPTRYVPSPKRLVGHVPAALLGGDEYALGTLIAPVLAAAYERALAAHNGDAPALVVLTHPEAWSPQQIATLTAAATRAGADPAAVVTVPEPRAAAHHYSRATPAEPGTTIAVFDFGGGTLDVAVLTATGAGRFEVSAARGDNTLGGKDFDARLRRWIEEQLGADEPTVAGALRTAPLHLQRSIDEQIRAAKELLSESPSATVTLDTGTSRHTVSITRGEFDELIGPDLDRAVALARATLADAGITGPDDLAALYLTGGSARIPLVHTRLGELGPVATLDDPKTVVAQGALLAVEDVPVPGGLDTVPLTRRPVVSPLAGASPAATSDRATRRWSRVAAAAVAVTLIAVAAVAIVAVRALNGDSMASADASPPTQGATAPLSLEPGGGRDSADPRNVTDHLPEPVSRHVVNCRAVGFSFDGGDLEVDCDLPAGSSLVAGRVTENRLYDTLSMKITAVDKNTALQNVLSIRSYTDPVDVRENDTRTAALDVSSLHTGSTMVVVANTDLGLLVNIHGVRDSESAEAFVRESGLFG